MELFVRQQTLSSLFSKKSRNFHKSFLMQ